MLIEKYRASIEKAEEANYSRGFYYHYPEHPKAYGEDGAAKGEAAFRQLLNQPFNDLLQDGKTWCGEEISPYTGEKLGITYPAAPVDTLTEQAGQAWNKWSKAAPMERAAILMDSLEKVKARFFEIAYATMHTTGQSFIMSFQASGPHAADRALEAIAMGVKELTRFPGQVEWRKPMGKFDITLEKTYKPIPKGIGLVIGCSTFPVWNSLPGLYADLITGNPVIVKPHPGAILPIAIVMAEIQKTFKEHGYDPHLCQLAADTAQHPLTKHLCEHPDIKLIDYTGSTAFGNYVESLSVGQNGNSGKTVFTEKAGINSVILDSVKSMDEVADNLAFSLCLYSGQMCTAPQNFFIPSSGINTDQGKLTYEEVVEKLKAAINRLVANPKMGAGTLGAIQNEKTLDRAKRISHDNGNLILQGEAISNPEFEHARTFSPTIIETRAQNQAVYAQELFGPMAVIIQTKDTDESVQMAKMMAEKQGAITCSAYTTDQQVMEKIADEMNSAFTPVSFNLTGFIWVNQHAAFSDFHVTGGNPAGNAGFADPVFIGRRFIWVGNRMMKTR